MQTTYPRVLTFASRKPRETLLATLAIAAVPIWLYLQLFRDALIDDTFITLQYVRTLRDYGVWGFFPWESHNTATSPLNVILTTITSLVVRDIVLAALALATIEAVVLLGALLLLGKRIGQGYAFGALAFVAVLGNPLLISTLGLEPLLYVTLLVCALYAFMSNRTTALAVLLALLTLARPDGALLFPIMLGAVLVQGRGQGRSLVRLALRFGLVYGAVLLPWYLFSWIALGSLVPSTLLIKRGQGNWEGYNFFNGWRFYLQRYPREVPLALLLVPFAALCLRIRARPAAVVAGLLFAFGAVYYAAYVALGVPPYHWYFVPVVIPCVILGVLGLLTFAQQQGAAQHAVMRYAWYALTIVVVLYGVSYLSDGRALPLVQSPIHTNWATHDRYREIGLWLKENVPADANIQLGGEIGTVAFYSERRVADVFSCRFENFRIERDIARMRGWVGALARANFRWLRTDTACRGAAYELRMYNWPASVVDYPRNVLKQWVISTDWVASGRVVLARR